MTTGQPSFPRQYARTQRFTLGAPRGYALSPDGARVVFLRSASGTDRAQRLWVLDLDEGREFTAADPLTLLAGADEELSPEEQARRERTREGSAGVVGYAVDEAVELAAFTLSGRLFVSELRAGTTRELPVQGPVVDPRPSPDGRQVAFVAQGGLRVVAVDGAATSDGAGAPGDGTGNGPTADRILAAPDGPQVTWGLAEFIAAEEMGRHRGFWWSPDSDRLLAARVDESPVRRWWIADPAHPDPGRLPYGGHLGPCPLPLSGARALVRGRSAAAAGAIPRPARTALSDRRHGDRRDPYGARRRGRGVGRAVPRGARLDSGRTARTDRGRGRRPQTVRRRPAVDGCAAACARRTGRRGGRCPVLRERYGHEGHRGLPRLVPRQR